MPTLELDFDSTSVIVVLLTALALGAAWLAYRRTVAPLRPLTRSVLVALRTTLLSLMLFLLFAPVLRLARTSSRLPVLAVLADNSESMRTADRPTTRAQQLTAVLHSRALSEVAGFAAVRWFTFGDHLRPWDRSSADSLSLHEPTSNFAEALQSLQRESEREKIGAALMITDGTFTAGQNPVHGVERRVIPLFTVGVGDSSEQRDVIITRVSANDRVFSGTASPVDVHVKSSGFSSGAVDVVLTDGSAILDRTTIPLAEGTREYAVRLSYRPEGEEMRQYTVRVSPMPGELTLANNARSFYVRVLRSKLHVLLLAGGPSPDVSAVRQTLSEDADIDLRTLVVKSPSEFYEGSLTPPLLDSADCLVSVGFPTPSTPEASLRLISDAIARRELPLFFIGGRSIDDSRLKTFGSALPFSTELPSATEQLVYIQPAGSDVGREILGLGTPGGADAWAKLPPVFRTLTAYHIRPEATLLATARTPVQGSFDPLLVARNVDHQKSLALLGYGIWRWRLMAQEGAESSGLFPAFLSTAVRWLTTRDDRSNLRVTPVRDFFHRGEAVGFAGQLYDATNHPLDNARVRVTVHSAAGLREVDLHSAGSGRYEGQLDGLEEGEYSYTAFAETGGSRMESQRGKFAVGGLDLEFQETRSDVQLLHQLAARSGGRFLTAGTIDSLPGFLRSLRGFSPSEVRHELSLELWNWQYVLALLVGLLALEWFLRKRSGML
jgi:hypothetical protein